MLVMYYTQIQFEKLQTYFQNFVRDALHRIKFLKELHSNLKLVHLILMKYHKFIYIAK